jgi:protoporphyrin/coproporphyrin ferrochelatase
MSSALLLVAHGTVENLDDLDSFVKNVRRGRPPPPGLIAELRRRYEAIGGASPLNAINEELGRKLEARLGLRVAWANRLWRPYVRDRLIALADCGVRRVLLIPLAQHSAAVYEADARAPAAEAGVELVCSSNWGQNAKLCEAFASRIVAALARSPVPEQTTIVMTAHSLPKFVILGGDPYEREVGAAIRAITAAVQSRVARVVRVAVAFQGQALSGPGPDGRPPEWLGPDLREAFADVARHNDRHVIVAPVGFLADHVEILYDLDIEACRWAADVGLTFDRVPSLNASDDFVDVLEDIARALIAHG